jgi:NADH:ubiquinone oxidoreductase subunit E
MSIPITICIGPTCGRMSGHEMLRAAQALARRHPGRLEVSTWHCFARCQERGDGLCPSVRIGDEWLHDADETKVKRRLQALLAQPPPASNADLPLWQ